MLTNGRATTIFTIALTFNMLTNGRATTIFTLSFLFIMYADGWHDIFVGNMFVTSLLGFLTMT